MTIENALLSVNHAPGRRSTYPIDVIVIHVTEGSERSVRSWFTNPRAEVSAHYLVTTDGRVVQFVREADTAWHAGRVAAPSAAIIQERAGTNPNTFSIGIEHEGSGTTDLTEPQRFASLELIRDICRRRAIPIDRRHIIGHREIFVHKTCPGKINLDRLVQEAAAIPTVSAPAVRQPPRIVYSEFLDDYLIVTEYRNDAEWSFVPFKQLPAGIRAQTPLSQMPKGAVIA